MKTLMKAIVIDRFGGPDTLKLKEIPVPTLDAHEVLIRVEYAGVGQWDPFEREGGYAEMLGLETRFPYVLGSEAAGMIVEVGAGVKGLRAGDAVLGLGFLNAKGGCYAEFAALRADLVVPRGPGMTPAAAAAVGGVGITALRGIDDVLRLQPGETLVIHGASGGLGHIAVQLAKRRSARVFAVASGPDGVSLIQKLGADDVVDGRRDDVMAALRTFAPGGVDAMLLAAGADPAWLEGVRRGGRVAYPTGIQPEPPPRPGIEVQRYNGDPDRDILRRLQEIWLAEPITTHVSHEFPLEEAAAAHEAVGRHHLGKLVLKVS